MKKDLILNVKSMYVINNIKKLNVELENNSTSMNYLLPMDWCDKLELDSPIKCTFSNEECTFQNPIYNVIGLSKDKFGKICINIQDETNQNGYEISTYDNEIVKICKINGKLNLEFE